MNEVIKPAVAAIENDLAEIEAQVETCQDRLEKATAGAESTRQEFLRAIDLRLCMVEKAKTNLAAAERMRDGLKAALLVLVPGWKPADPGKDEIKPNPDGVAI